MSYNNAYYLHFVADLRRVVFCITHRDDKGAQAFLDHAHKIFQEKLMQIMDGESKELRIDELWLDVYTPSLPEDMNEKKRISEKVLTLSSMIFLRSTKNMPVLPHASKMAEKAPVISAQ